MHYKILQCKESFDEFKVVAVRGMRNSSLLLLGSHSVAYIPVCLYIAADYIWDSASTTIFATLLVLMLK